MSGVYRTGRCRYRFCVTLHKRMKHGPRTNSTYGQSVSHDSDTLLRQDEKSLIAVITSDRHITAHPLLTPVHSCLQVF
jgi:hypothetical protein